MGRPFEVMCGVEQDVPVFVNVVLHVGQSLHDTRAEGTAVEVHVRTVIPATKSRHCTAHTLSVHSGKKATYVAK
jgi:hypothetical protein